MQIQPLISDPVASKCGEKMTITCVESVLNNSYPGIEFDSNGVSNIAASFKLNTLPLLQNLQKNQIKSKG